jgi:CRP/FNR family transcriptional regulator, cyclic AMP receptor protein
MQKMKSYKKDQIVVAEGTKDSRLFILVDGRVGVFKHDLKVAEFNEPGTIMGEMTIILKQPRTATMKALEDANIIEIDTTLEELFKTSPDIAIKMMKNLAERLSKTTKDYWKLSENVNVVVDLKYLVKK